MFIFKDLVHCTHPRTLCPCFFFNGLEVVHKVSRWIVCWDPELSTTLLLEINSLRMRRHPGAMVKLFLQDRSPYHTQRVCAEAFPTIRAEPIFWALYCCQILSEDHSSDTTEPQVYVKFTVQSVVRSKRQCISPRPAAALAAGRHLPPRSSEAIPPTCQTPCSKFFKPAHRHSQEPVVTSTGKCQRESGG